jgi:hypothetical protein
MKKHNFPVLVELEMIPKGKSKFEVVYSQVAHDNEMLYRKIQYIKTLYNLVGVDYRINITVQSLMNYGSIKSKQNQQ